MDTKKDDTHFDDFEELTQFYNKNKIWMKKN